MIELLTIIIRIWYDVLWVWKAWSNQDFMNYWFMNSSNVELVLVQIINYQSLQIDKLYATSVIS